jgi:predicted dehydrogenase
MHILIIGFGSIGQKHLRVIRSILPDAKITVVRQHNTVNSAHPPEGANSITDNLQLALRHNPDAAVLAGPAKNRMDIAKILATSGVHILAEKPISMTIDGVKEVLEIAAKNNIVFMVGHVLRQLPVLNALKQSIDNGDIGQMFSLHAQVGQHLADWRSGTDYRSSVSAQKKLGGGALFELSHELDYVRWLLGQPTSVTCRTSQAGDLGIDAETCADLILEFPDHIQASVHLDFIQRPASRTCVVNGSLGKLTANLIEGTLHLTESETGQTQKIQTPSNKDRDAIFIQQAEHFLTCIKNGLNPLVSGYDGFDVLKITLAAKHSAVSNSTIFLSEQEL